MNNHEHEEEFSQIMIKNKNIFIFGEINPNTTGQFLAAFQEADSIPGLITVTICSGGGWVEGGMCMYDTIRSSTNLVRTVGCGAIYSAAVLPFIAGDTREMQTSASLFLHDMSISMSESTLKQMKTVEIETSRLYKLYCQYLADRTDLDVKDADMMLQSETYLTSLDCLNNGITHSVILHNSINDKYNPEGSRRVTKALINKKKAKKKVK